MTKTNISKVPDIINIVYELRNRLSYLQESAYSLTALKGINHEFIKLTEKQIRLAKTLIVKRRWVS